MKIDNTTFPAKKFNYISEVSEKTQIVVSNSLRKNNYHLIRLQNKEFEKTKKWNMFTISREGNIYQHFSDDYYSNFLENEEWDKKIISIVLENMGLLYQIDNKYYNFLNECCDDELVVEKKWLEFIFWEKYNNKQIRSFIDLSYFLSNKHQIPLNLIDFFNYHKDTTKFKGIVFHSNYYDQSTTINPTFDVEIFNKK